MTSGAERRVLIVEDDQDARELLQQLLELNGFHTSMASNGREALGLLDRHAGQICLVLLDLMMPVMNGWEFRAAQLADARLKRQL